MSVDDRANDLEKALDAVEVRLEGVSLKVDRIFLTVRASDDGAIAKLVRRIGGSNG